MPRPDGGGQLAGQSLTFLGLRLNDWTSVLVFLGAITYLVVSACRHPGVEDVSRPKHEGGNEMAGEPRPGRVREAARTD